MEIFIKNSNNVLWLCLNLLRWVGFLVPDELTGLKKMLYPLYFGFWFMFIVGVYIISQSVALLQKWGDVSEMTGISFLLFTNLSFAIKIFNSVQKTKVIQAIIDEGEFELSSEISVEGQEIIRRTNKETTRRLCIYIVDVIITLSGWVISTEKNQLPFHAWYPYDYSKFPAYQLTFLHQVAGVIGIATMNVSLDFVATTQTSICRCRLHLVNLALRNLCIDINVTNKLLTESEEQVVKERLRHCVVQHQATLDSAALIQKCFTTTILVQFSVVIIIICATAYQLAQVTSDKILWSIPMASYFIGMILQVYFYCNEAHKLTEESSLIADAVYECPWYVCSVPLRRALLIVMVRSRRETVLTAGGFTTLSHACFVSICRLSYSFFTVLKQMEE